MKRLQLGKTDMNVSRLAFGCLCMGYLQHNLSDKEGGELILHAMDRGINFFDTAQFYKTYSHIRYAVKNGAKDLILCTKSYAYDTKTAQEAFEEAIRESGKDVIDVFLIHEVEETEKIHTIKGHYEALSYYLKMKEKGYIRAVGVSTHFSRAVHVAADMPEIDVIEPIINKNGIGIVDANREIMEKEIAYAHEKGKGIIAMKALGGGNLFREAKSCYDYIDQLYGIDTILTGMVRKEEIDANCDYFEGEYSQEAFQALSTKPKKLVIDDWCVGCGECVKRCPNNAMSLVDGKAHVDRDKCLTCGYCSGACKEMALKII